MASLYFTRHGETVWNVKNKICGVTDIELTEKGHKQAIELGKKIIAENFKIDEILCSPLVRAFDTAKHISTVTGIPMKIDIRLKEQNFGKYESTERDGKEFKEAKSHFVDNFGGGETMLRLAQRIYNLLDELKEDKNKTYLLVAHNGISRVVKSYFCNMTNEEYGKFGISNCELLKFDF